MTTETTQIFPIHPGSVTAARRWIRRLLADRGCIDTAELATSELVSNVVRHASRAHRIEMTVQVSSDRVRIEVAQPHDRQMDTDDVAPLPEWPERTQPDGRGLRIVEALSLEWGIAGDGEAATWCEIPCSDSDVAEPSTAR